MRPSRLHILCFSLAVLSVFVLPFPASCLAAQPAPSLADGSSCRLVVLAQPDDPYYSLAEEIAAAENAPLAGTLAEALACEPEFLLWVVAPGSLSDAVMVEFGQAMKAHPTAVSTGIISGSTLDQARQLWERRTQVRGQNLFAANAPNPSAHIAAGRITDFSGEQPARQPLTLSTFRTTLHTADYLTFTGHGSSGYIRLDEDTKLTSAEVPPLDGVVVSTGSCQTFRLWDNNSIARRFADQGAAAYSGFVYSPNEGYLIGEFDGLPFRYTWPDFPIGHVIQVQNQGTLQGFAFIPYQYLLGDPRIALQTEPPYRLVEDRRQGQERILRFQDAPAGVIPLRVVDGAAYRFVRVAGLTAAAARDPFYNSKLQMVDLQNDKLILLVHPGGELVLQMRRQAPWYWFPSDILFDSLDHAVIYAQQTGGDILALGFAILPILWGGWRVFKKRFEWSMLRPALAVATGATLLQGIYVLLRLDQVTITSKMVAFSPLSLLATFVLAACGVLFYGHARGWVGKVSALLVMTFAFWAPVGFGLLMLAAFNLFTFIPKFGAPLYNYSLALLPAGAFVFTFLLSALVLGTIFRQRRAARQKSWHVT